MIALLMSKFSGYAAIIAGAVAFVTTIFLAGKRAQRKDTDIAGLKDFVLAQEKINEVVINTDISDATDRLSKNNQLRD